MFTTKHKNKSNKFFESDKKISRHDKRNDQFKANDE